jgi:hypothetical protein
MRFRFKCHEVGQAIRIKDSFITFCNCITFEEMEAVVRTVKELKDADV